MVEVKRLVKQFKPENYQLRIKPSFTKPVFEGRVTITGHAIGPTVLHAKNLNIKSVTINDQPVRWRHNSKTDELTLNKQITGNVEILISYSGQITDNMHGLYRAYFNYRGKKELLLATQLEAIHAREMLPCVDEPEAKAVFELALEYPKHLTAIANTPIKHSRIKGGNRLTEFEPTPIMSTYLLAFVIGNIKSLSRKSKRGVEVNLYATPDNVAYLKFAAEITPKILDFYESYFGIKYPLSKLDLIAVPDFSAGAMENWGLVTYYEGALLVDPRTTTVGNKQWVAMVIAHELAHQWFGNLVTMEWWTDLWLNEGFASWIEFLAVDKLFPQWQMWTQFVGSNFAGAMDLDGLANTHPVEVTVQDPAEIPQIFDAISYDKGSSVIRMLENYLGAATFRKGLEYYLNKYAYANATTQDLWRALEEISGKPVVKFMSAWTSLPGHPLIRYQKTATGHKFTQERYIAYPKAKQQLRTGTTWPVPLSMLGNKDAKLLSKRSDSWQINKLGKLNPRQAHFYRVCYTSADLKELANKVTKLPPEDRAGLLLDAADLARSGFTPTTDWLELITHYKNEDNPVVWGILSSGILEFLKVFNTKDSEQIENAFAPLGIQLIRPQFERLGWDPKSGDSHFDQLLRPIALMWMARLEDATVIAEAQKRFAGHAASSKPLYPDVRGAVYSAVARHGGRAEYEQLWQLYQQAEAAEEKRRLASALSQFKQPELIRRSLGAARSSKVKLQNATTWIATAISGRYSKDIAWEWFQQNWDWMEKSYGGGIGHLGNLINALGYSFTDMQKHKEIAAFLKKKNPAGTQRNIKQALEAIETSALWKQRDYGEALAWLKNQ